MFSYLTQMGIAPALMKYSDPQSWTVQTVSNMLEKCLSTGIGWNVAPTSIDETCCHSWCEQLTSCFSQLPPWKKDCVRMWRCRKKPRKQISIILTNTTDSSYLGRIKVKQCWKLNFPAIKITPSSEVRVFDFLVTFLVPVVVVTLISPFRECRYQSHS